VILSAQWLIFCDPGEVNSVWNVVARATANGELGIAAKVAPRPEDGSFAKDRVVCVYTEDFQNKRDVGRVVQKLRELRLVEARGKTLYYKPGELGHRHHSGTAGTVADKSQISSLTSVSALATPGVSGHPSIRLGTFSRHIKARPTSKYVYYHDSMNIPIWPRFHVKNSLRAHRSRSALRPAISKIGRVAKESAHMRYGYRLRTSRLFPASTAYLKGFGTVASQACRS
jgi:hypothetical protein